MHIFEINMMSACVASARRDKPMHTNVAHADTHGDTQRQTAGATHPSDRHGGAGPSGFAGRDATVSTHAQYLHACKYVIRAAAYIYYISHTAFFLYGTAV